MPQYTYKEMQITNVIIYAVHTVVCPGTLHAYMFNTHSTRNKNILCEIHILLVWKVTVIIAIVCFRNLNCIWVVEGDFEEVQSK